MNKYGTSNHLILGVHMHNMCHDSACGHGGVVTVPDVEELSVRWSSQLVNHNTVLGYFSFYFPVLLRVVYLSLKMSSAKSGMGPTNEVNLQCQTPLSSFPQLAQYMWKFPSAIMLTINSARLAAEERKPSGKLHLLYSTFWNLDG